MASPGVDFGGLGCVARLVRRSRDRRRGGEAAQRSVVRSGGAVGVCKRPKGGDTRETNVVEIADRSLCAGGVGHVRIGWPPRPTSTWRSCSRARWAATRWPRWHRRRRPQSQCVARCQRPAHREPADGAVESDLRTLAATGQAPFDRHLYIGHEPHHCGGGAVPAVSICVDRP